MLEVKIIHWRASEASETVLLGVDNAKSGICYIYIYYSFDTGEYHESVGLVFTRVPQARA